MSRKEFGSSTFLDYPQPHFPFKHSYIGFLINYFSNVSNIAPYGKDRKVERMQKNNIATYLNSATQVWQKQKEE